VEAFKRTTGTKTGERGHKNHRQQNKVTLTTTKKHDHIMGDQQQNGKTKSTTIMKDK